MGVFKKSEKPLVSAQLSDKIYILLDSQAAVTAFQTVKSTSSLEVTSKFYQVAAGRRIYVRWVPGHSEITGDKKADKEARAALGQLSPKFSTSEKIILAYLRRLMHRERRELIDKWWSEACQKQYKQLDFQMHRKKPPEHLLSHHLLQKLIAARIGHGNFADYYRRFHHEGTILECAYGKETNKTNFIRFRLYIQNFRMSSV